VAEAIASRTRRGLFCRDQSFQLFVEVLDDDDLRRRHVWIADRFRQEESLIIW
jgi:hypothetical protein